MTAALAGGTDHRGAGIALVPAPRTSPALPMDLDALTAFTVATDQLCDAYDLRIANANRRIAELQEELTQARRTHTVHKSQTRAIRARNAALEEAARDHAEQLAARDTHIGGQHRELVMLRRTVVDLQRRMRPSRAKARA